MTSIKQQIHNIISQLSINENKDIASCISDIIVKNNNVGFTIDIQDKSPEEGEAIRNWLIQEIKSRATSIDKITIVLTKNKLATTKSLPQKPKQLIDNVKKIILVSAGKGGVGKSTISAIIAENLRQKQFNVGIIDADIYGPSIPTIFNIHHKPEIKNGLMLPLVSRGVQLNSIGFINPTDDPIAWRGPMISKAIYQLLSLTAWDNLDYLLIDMPPGTGDIHLSILGNYNIFGGIIVTTPQKISAIDVKKSIELYQKFELPILALIENMSYFIDSDGKKSQIFVGNSGKEIAEKYNISFMHQLALDPKIAAACDSGNSLNDLVQIPLEFLY